MRYYVRIAGRTIVVDVHGDRVVVDGSEMPAELRTVEGTPVRNLLAGGVSWIIPMEGRGRGEWVVQRWGDRFDVEVIDERTNHIRSLVGGGREHQGPAVIRAPMPGLVVRVLVAPGADVAAGQGLVVLEAMKMENELKAAGPGIVERIHVEPGQAVEKGAVLVSFAPSAAS